MQGNERWRPLTGSNNPSARLRAARSMPQWLHARGSALPPPPPPPPPLEEPQPDPDYEVIEFPGQAYSNAPLQHEVKMRGEGRRCDLCGSSAPAVQCWQCSQQNFCPSCDDMYHRHPKRQAHVRKALEARTSTGGGGGGGGQQVRPPLPPKGEPAVAPVPPPRRNKRLQHTSRPTTPTPLFDQGMMTAPSKKDVGIVGSLKRMITGRPLPPPPMNRQMDRFGGMQPSQMRFQDDPRMIGRDGFGYPDWDMERGQRSGSMTALNMVPPPFSPMMQAHSMAQLNCPSCHHHGMMWGGGGDWGGGGGGQMWAGGGMHPVAGSWQGSGMIPPYRAEEHEPLRRNSLRAPLTTHHHHHQQHKQRYRRGAGGSSSDDEDEEAMSSRGSRRGGGARRAPRQESDFEDSDEDAHPAPSSIGGKRISRRASLAEGIDRRGRHDDDTMSVRGTRRYDREAMTPRSTRRMLDREETASMRGGRRRSDLEDGKRSVLDGAATERPARRRSDLEETVSERGGGRYARELAATAPRTARRTSAVGYDEEAVFERGAAGRKSDIDETLSVRSGRRGEPPRNNTIAATARRNERFSDTGRRRRSPVDLRVKKESPPKISTPSTEESAEEEPAPAAAPATLNGGAESPSLFGAEEPEEEEEEEEPLGPVPTAEWECQHCTFVNEPGTRVCAVCCKTTSRPKLQKTEVKIAPKQQQQQQPPPQQHHLQQRQQEPKKQRQEERLSESVGRMSLAETRSSATSPRPDKKKGPTVLAERNKSVTSKGTSPPPQSISTQTYEVLANRKLKRASSLADHEWNQPPLRSLSRQSLLSDTQSLPVTPPRSRSPDAESQATTGSQAESRRISEPASLSTNSRRSGSQPSSDYMSTLVQKQVKQGLEMVKLLREAEEQQFTAEDLGVALSHCGENDPVGWLIDNWQNMIDTVVTLATNYGHERKENIVGTISAAEAREALRLHNGNVWAAVTDCVEQRQKKYGELLSRGNFTREDIVTSLTANHGNLEAAYVELSKSQLKPFLMRIWGPPQGADNDSAPPPPYNDQPGGRRASLTMGSRRRRTRRRSDGPDGRTEPVLRRGYW